MQINGVELEFNYMEEETNKRTIKAMEKVKETAEQANEEKKLPKKISIMCEGIKEAFDLIFGSGTGDSVCGKKNDLQKCSDAYKELLYDVRRQDRNLNETTKEISSIFPEEKKNELPD